MDSKYTYENLEVMTVAELKGIVKELGVTGYSKSTKYDIIDMILSEQGVEVTQENLAEKTIAELKDIARNLDMKVEKGVTKADLLNRILAVDAGGKDEVHAFGGNIEAAHNMVQGGPATITVSCGASGGKFPVIGKTVNAVADFLKEILNIDPTATAMVNGETVKGNFVLGEGDNVEFVKQAGSKGC